MGDFEKEVMDSNASENELTVEELVAKTAKTANKKKEKSTFFSSLRAEFKKIVWPTRQVLIKKSIAVLASSVILGVVIAVIDLIIRLGLELIV